MTALAIIIDDPARAGAALRVAAAAAVLGRPVALLFDGRAVALLAASAPHALLRDALTLGVRVTACQTGMADCGLDASGLVAGATPGGMIGFMSDAGDAQLILA
jgi:predicted peroxiredoxin